MNNETLIDLAIDAAAEQFGLSRAEICAAPVSAGINSVVLDDARRVIALLLHNDGVPYKEVGPALNRHRLTALKLRRMAEFLCLNSLSFNKSFCETYERYLAAKKSV